MRPATLLGEHTSCSRRTSAGPLRSLCQRGRSGRLVRVVSATAPPSSPTSSNPASQTSLGSEAGITHVRNGNVVLQQPPLVIEAATLPQTTTANAAPIIDQNSTAWAQQPTAAPPTVTVLTSPSPSGSPQNAATVQPSITVTSPSSPPESLLGANGAPAANPTSPAASPARGQRVATDMPVATSLAETALPSAGNGAPHMPGPSASGGKATVAVVGATPSGSNGRVVASAGRTAANSPQRTPPSDAGHVPASSTGTAFPISGVGDAANVAAGGPSAAAPPPVAAAAGAPPPAPSSPSASNVVPPNTSAVSAPQPAGSNGAGPTASATAAPASSQTPATGPSPPGSPSQTPAAAGLYRAPSSPGAAAAHQMAAATVTPATAVAAPSASGPSTPTPQGSPAPSSTSSSSPSMSAPTANAVAAFPAAQQVPTASSSSTAASAGAQTAPAASPSTTGTGAAPSAPSSTSTTAATNTPPSTTTANASSAGSGGSGVAAAGAPINSDSLGFQLRPIHVVIFAAIFLGGALFAALTLQFTADLDFQMALTTVARRVTRSQAFRQLCVIACAICLVRFGLNNVLRALAKFSSSPVQWDKSKVYYILKEVYQPLELLLFIAAICTIADSFVPQLIAVPRSTVSTVVRSTLSVSFIIGAATVVFNLKSRFCKENAWQSEMNGDVTAQRRWEAYDKLGTFVIYAITFVLGIQALGLEVTSVLAIGGIGGLAIGLAGREICENILNGFLIMSTSPFEVGDEVHFFHSHKVVEGIVLDIGWYRTTIRSYEREVFVIPNAVFSKNIVLNITRKHREWRFFEMVCVRVQDVHKVNAIIQDIRRIVRNDQRIITKLHRRIFLDKVTHEDCRIYVSFYVEAQNRESFMAAKQDLLLAFVDCVERNGAKLAVPRTTVQMEPEMAEALAPIFGAAAAMAAAKVTMEFQQATGNVTAAAARALTDGRTITAEVTAVPSASSPGGASASGGTTATSAKAAAAGATAGSPGGGAKTSSSSGAAGAGSAGQGATQPTEVLAVGSGGAGGGAAAVAPAGQGSSKGTPEGGVTWLLSKLAQVLFET